MSIRRLLPFALGFLLATAAVRAQTSRFQPGASVPTVTAGLLEARRNAVGQIQTRADAEARQVHVRDTMLRLLGPLPEKTPLNPVVMGSTMLSGYRIEKIMFDSQPGFHVTALLYVPDTTLVKSFPAIVMAPGHSPAGKAGDFAMASAFARNGFVVLSYDPIGQGERLQYPDPANPGKSLATRPTGEHGEAGLQPVLIGESVAKYFFWDGVRAVDYLLTRREVDPARIGALGCSGGGAMTAILGALDARVAAVGTACYITNFNALLPGLGPQDGEQSTPGWIRRGLDFADYVEVAAPRPYAIISTTEDMFPFAGAQASEVEARRFYSLFEADHGLSFIYGPGGHGNLKPMLPRILKFFIDALQASPFPPVYDDQSPQQAPPADAFQVTPTGQVATFDADAATVFSLNLAHARTLPMAHPTRIGDLQQAITRVSGTTARPLGEPTPPRTMTTPAQPYESAAFPTANLQVAELASPPNQQWWRLTLPQTGNLPVVFVLAVPKGVALPGLGLVVGGTSAVDDSRGAINRMLAEGNVVLTVLPQQPAPHHPEIKSPLLGPWYLDSLEAELAGKTLLGQRMDATVLVIDYLSSLRMAHKAGISALADGHWALVLLHAAIFDSETTPRLKRITLSHLPPTYAELLATPLPKDAPEDILPGVLLQYDTPDLLRALKVRVNVVYPTVVRQPHLPLTPLNQE